jgi:flap endonuclease-1
MAATLEEYMVEDSKKLLTFLGIPVVQAPSEGEAQASYMAIKGDVWAVGSQDYDSFLFGAPRIVRNITLTGKVRYPSKGVEIKLEPELVYLKEVLDGLGITREQLIEIGILIGTDYNEGIKGIGPKKALDLIKSYRSIDNIPNIMEKISKEEILEIKHMFLSPEITDDYKLDFKDVDYEGIMKFLCEEHDFNPKRVNRALSELKEATSIKSLDQWFS